jgi:hypothetical protein
MKTTISVVLLSLIAAACGGGSSGGSGSSNVVSFEVDPVAGPTCHGATKQSTFEGSLWKSIDCTWYCASYKNHVNAYVSIDFRREHGPGETWAKSHEYISDGIC